MGALSDLDRSRSSAELVGGWGRHPVRPGRVWRPEDLSALPGVGTLLPRGLGRAYGDAAVPASPDTHVIATTRADRILDFDPASGRLTCEAGLSLADIVRIFLPRGWFPSVTPGTKFVTVGGCVAADVHGKNHHRDGCFGRFVDRLRLRVADGSAVVCSPTVERDLFLATVGGMGLTGLIVEATLRLRAVESPWMVVESEPMPHLDAMLEGLRASALEWPYTVGWLDGLARGRGIGRGILMRGRHAQAVEVAGRQIPRPRALRVPLDAPTWLLSGPFMRLFNGFYYRRHGAAPSRRIAFHEEFFYPLDALRDWNRLYGRPGFLQYQCVVPRAAGAAAVSAAPRPRRRGGRRVVPVGGEGLRSRLGGLPLVPDGGHDAGPRLALPRQRDGCPRPRAERGRAPCGWARVPGQGRGDARGGFRPHGAAARPVEGRPRSLGPWTPLPLRSVGAPVGGPPVKAVVVGATRGMGRALARLLAERGAALFLVGRDAAELQASARDLEVRGNRGPVGHSVLDLSLPAGFPEALDAADRALGGFDTLVVTAGLYDRQDDLAADPARLARLLHVNFTGAAVLCQLAALRLAERGGGTVCAFSSVAGDRPRRSTYLYGASKAGLSAFLDGLGLAYGDRGVRVVCVKPGFVKTGMTAGLPVPPFAGEPEAVARIVLRAMERGRAVVYAPPVWRAIMWVIRSLPRAVMRRVSF